jgi:hypothetical protein
VSGLTANVEETPRAGTNADSRTSYPHVFASQGDVAAATECILDQSTLPSWLIGGEFQETLPEAIVNRRSKREQHRIAYLFTPPAKTFNHLSIQSQREWRLRSIVRASSRVSRSIWSHDCVMNSFSMVESCMCKPGRTRKRKGTVYVKISVELIVVV